METPIISVVIPCRNEEKYIASCIDSVLRADYPSDKLQVLVSDGESDDGTRDILRQYEQKYSNVKMLDNKQRTTQYALNLGIRESKGNVIMILGAHAEVEKGYFKHSIEVFEKDEKIGCAGGVIENIHENKSAEVISKAMSSTFGVGNAHFRTGEREGYVDTVAFGAYKREVFEKIGLFDEDLIRNQDDEFNFRLIKNGYKIYLSKKIRSKYYVRASYKKLFRQYFQYGYWKVFVNRKHKTITSFRQLIPFFLVLYIISGAILSFVHVYLAVLYLTGILIYLLTGFIFAIKASRGKGQSLKILYSFIILHFSYGWGYMKGILDFYILRKKEVEKKQTRLSR